jgi:hypothetical protein
MSDEAMLFYKFALEIAPEDKKLEIKRQMKL